MSERRLPDFGASSSRPFNRAVAARNWGDLVSGLAAIKSKTLNKMISAANDKLSMKLQSFNGTALVAAILTMLITLVAIIQPCPALASGGSGSGGGGGGGGTTTTIDTIRVNKCYYFDTGSYVELLINAGSSDSSAHLYAFLPDGTYLGEVQNGGGGRYGGTVFVTLHVPASITLVSSSGGRITAPTTPFQF
jgi:hypothetical protein